MVSSTAVGAITWDKQCTAVRCGHYKSRLLCSNDRTVKSMVSGQNWVVISSTLMGAVTCNSRVLSVLTCTDRGSVKSVRVRVNAGVFKVRVNIEALLQGQSVQLRLKMLSSTPLCPVTC